MLALLLLAGLSLAGSTSAGEATRTAEVPAEVRALVERGDHAALAALGDPALDALAELYRAGDRDARVRIAGLFYAIGKPSAAAELVLMEDVRTPDVGLRINVQYALGRVSGDDRVVEVLLDTLRHDPSPLLRDKAACALAYDQIHLTEKQKARLFAGLVEALADEELQIRGIAIQALQIHTGQSKGFAPRAPPEKRMAAILEWRRWLLEYERSLE